MTGNLALTTSNINALADGSAVKLEVSFTAPDGSQYTGQFNITIRKTVRAGVAVTTIPGDVVLGRAEAARTYFKRDNAAGDGFIIRSADGTQAAYVTLANDGHLDVSPLT